MQLQKASDQVADIQKELTELIPQLEAKAKQTAEKQKVIAVEQAVVEKEKIVVEAEAAAAKIKLDAADALKADCDAALNKVMPIYHSAVKAVNDLKSADITEFKSFKTAKGAAALVAEALCRFFKVKPTKEAGSKPGEFVMNYWPNCQKNVLTPTLLKSLKKYNKDDIDPQLVIDMQVLLANDLFSDGPLRNASVAVFGIGKWCRAIIEYDQAMKIVRPKQKERDEAQAEANTAKAASYAA